jgi:hypothetical protein
MGASYHWIGWVAIETIGRIVVCFALSEVRRLKARPHLWLPPTFALVGAGLALGWFVSREPVAGAAGTSTPATPDFIASTRYAGAHKRALVHLGSRVGRIDVVASRLDGATRRFDSRTIVATRRGERRAFSVREQSAIVDAVGILHASMRAPGLEVRASRKTSSVVWTVRVGDTERRHEVAGSSAGPLHTDVTLAAHLGRHRDAAGAPVGPFALLDLEHARIRTIIATRTDRPDGSALIRVEEPLGIVWSMTVDREGNLLAATTPVPGLETRPWRAGDDATPEVAVDLGAWGEVLFTGRVPADLDASSPRTLRLRGLPATFVATIAALHGDRARVRDDGALDVTLSSEGAPATVVDAALRAPAPFLESDAPDIRALAEKLAPKGAAPLFAARQVFELVTAEVRHADALAPPSALATLRARRGNCNEMAALAVALLRAAGHAARLVFGVAQHGAAFRYHAWAEVHDAVRFVAFDPALRRFPAAPTHLALAVGGIDAQAAVLAAAGRLELEVLPTEPSR